jgi:hypothetical protein
LAAVEHTGNVFWPPPTKFRSTCPVDVKGSGNNYITQKITILQN